MLDGRHACTIIMAHDPTLSFNSGSLQHLCLNASWVAALKSDFNICRMLLPEDILLYSILPRQPPLVPRATPDKISVGSINPATTDAFSIEFYVRRVLYYVSLLI